MAGERMSEQEILAKLSKHASDAFNLVSWAVNHHGHITRFDLERIKYNLACVLSYTEKLKKQLGQGHAR